MAWNSTWPLGTVSVKANKTPGQQNTTYIETTMGNSVVGTNTVDTRDHFWDVGADLDGRHRFIQSPAFTVGGLPEDPVLGTGMDGVRYIKSDGLTPSKVVGFYRNADNIYQYIPGLLTGTKLLNSSSTFVDIQSVPDNSYGEIFMWPTTQPDDKYSVQVGFFKAEGGTCQAWSINYQVEGTGTPKNAIKFGNGSDASGLNIRGRIADGDTGLTWNYKVTYRVLA
jgi:hypothetical protein